MDSLKPDSRNSEGLPPLSFAFEGEASDLRSLGAGPQHWTKGAPVDLAGTIVSEQSKMFCRPIALMGQKIVLRVSPVILPHEAIPTDLRQDGGGCDGETQPVPFDDGPLRERDTGKSEGINEQKIRRRVNRLDRPIHGEASRLQNIHGIDFLLARASDPKPDGPFRDLLIEPFPLGFSHLLRVIQSSQPEPAWQDHGSRNHRACKRPTPGLVEARHETVATLLGFYVEVVGGVHSHLLKRSANSLQQAALRYSLTAIGCSLSQALPAGTAASAAATVSAWPGFGGLVVPP